MKWLVALLFFVATAASAELNIKYIEHSLFMTVTSGQQSGKIICLENKKESREALPEGWTILTCNSLESRIKWVLCYANIEKRSFICGKKIPA